MKLKRRLLYTGVVAYSTLFFAGQAYAQKLRNPLKTSSIPELIGIVINAILGIVGSIALVMFVYGGLQWMLSGGNADRVKAGRQTFVWAILGLVVIFTSYIIVRTIFNTIAK
mgnify:CR=1 FL=1